ncbi:carboxypeptidase-like regulatory domain-containing protein [Streptomyces canus]|uniref:carboxypeptidase-like regulatory domain-containing protein n=1 Tax=Streptomyces canus TaxID=58343 RepID=UPI00340A69C9
MNSGDTISLITLHQEWMATDRMVRVEHGRRLSRPKDPHDPDRIAYYVMGGPDTRVWASTPFSAYSPAYRADDPMEWEFSVVTAEGGQVPAYGEISLRIGQTKDNEGPYYLAVPDVQDGALVTGDGSAPFGASTTFLAEFVEVRPFIGRRPTNIVCRQCAAVIGKVRLKGTGQPVAGARLTATSAALESDHPMTGVTGPDGAYRLSDPHGHDCLPPGPTRVSAFSDRHQDKSAEAVVPAEGSVTVDIEVECTEVSGKVVELVGSSELPMPGVEVNLTYDDHQTRGVFAYTDPVNGTFSFKCVRHTGVTISTSRAPVESRQVPSAGVSDVKLVVSRACASVKGTVKDGAGQPIKGARVTILTTTPSDVYSVETGEDGAYEMKRVCLQGMVDMKAGKDGFVTTSAFPSPTLPASGSVTVDFVLALVPKPDPGPTPEPTHVIDCTLFWGAKAPAPRDLDSHMTGPDPAQAGVRWHCFYPERNPVPYVKLDTDDVTYEGPEHIVVGPLQTSGSPGRMVPGEYHYWVRNFSGEEPFTSSDARVTFLVDGIDKGSFYASEALGDNTSEARVWRVFDFTVGADGSAVLNRLQFDGRQADHGYLMPDPGDTAPL